MGRRWRRGTVYIRNVLHIYVEVGGVYGEQVPREGTQTGETQGTICVLPTEVKGCNPTGGPGATPMVRSLRGAHAGGMTKESKEDL